MDDRRKKLYYRATHRGIKEMDLILSAFVGREIATMPEAELDLLQSLLEVPDHDLYLWLTSAMPVPDAYDTALFRRLRDQPPVTPPGRG